MALENDFDSYNVVFMNPSENEDADFLGWIQLTNAGESAGYIYLDRKSVKPRLGNEGGPGRPYIVFSRRPSEYLFLMQLLNDGRKKTIRIHNEGTENVAAFLEHKSDTETPAEILPK